MITDDINDKAYAEALKAVLDEIERLSPEKIEEKFCEVGNKFFPDDGQPKNIMLRDIHEGVIFDALNPYSPNSTQKETLERFTKITNDYLSGNFYPSYYALSGNYTDNHQGFTWSVQVKDSKFVIACGNVVITKHLREIADTTVVVGEEERDLKNFQQVLPVQINNLTLASSEIQEYLA